MKKYFIVLWVLVVGFYACGESQRQSAKKITVKGHIKFADANDQFGITLNKKKNDAGLRSKYQIVKEITLDAENNYSFDIEVENPEFYKLDVYKEQSVEFYADDEDLEINFRGIDTAKIKIKNPPHVHIKGGVKNNVLNALNWSWHQTYQRMIAAGNSIYAASLTESKEWQEHAAKGYEAVFQSHERDIKNIVEMYSDYPTVVKAVERLSWKKYKDYMLGEYETLAKKFPEVPYIQNVKADLLEKMTDVEKTKIGRVAPDFTFPDIDGNMVSLSSFKGKYVLIDFWASWCGPCRKESPNVQKQYRLYKNKGFEVVSVSIDKKEDAWRKAIKEDKLEGTLLLAQDSEKIMKDYVFSGIPYMVLLDKEGRVMALNLRGDGLKDKLKEVFGS